MIKRGLSNIVSAVLIILLAIVAIAVFWNFFGKSLTSSSQSASEASQALILGQNRFSIVAGTLKVDENTKDISFLLKRDMGNANVSGVDIVLNGKNGKTFKISKVISINSGETKMISILSSEYIGFEGIIESIEIYATSSSGGNIISASTPSGEYKPNLYVNNTGNYTGGGGSPSVCNNGSLETNEDCDGGLFKIGSNLCTAYNSTLYSGGVLNCSASCTVLTINCVPKTQSGLSNGLVSYWKFDEGSGNIVYDSVTGRNGTAVNTTAANTASPSIWASSAWVDGVSGNALNFSVDGYIKAVNPTGLDLGGKSFSISVWLNPSTKVPPRWRTVFEYARGSIGKYGIWQPQVTNDIQFRVGNNATQTVNVIGYNTWYHFVGVFNSSTQRMDWYLNGELDKSYISTGAAFGYTSGDLTIGGNAPNTGLSESYYGLIDELRVYNRTLNSSEVREIYDLNAPGYYKKLTKATYRDKVAGSWMGQFIGNFLALSPKTEGYYNYNPNPLTWTWYNLTLGPINLSANDDHSVEWMYIHMLETYGTNPTYANVAQEWREHMAVVNGISAMQSEYWWCANWAAKNNIYNGINPPYSGNSTNSPNYSRSGAEAIDAQIETEEFGAMMPGMPTKAQNFVDFMSRVTADGVAVDYAEFYAIMYSKAFFDNNVSRIIDETQAMYPHGSTIYQEVDNVKQQVRNNVNWRTARQNLNVYWNTTAPYGPRCNTFSEAKVNFAFTIMSLLYGNGDFNQTVQISTLAGMDNDCNAASAAGFLGAISGESGIPSNYMSAMNVAGGYTGMTAMHPGLANSESVSSIVNRTVALGEKFIKSNGGLVTGSPGNEVYVIKTN